MQVTAERLTPFGAELRRDGLSTSALATVIAAALRTERLAVVRDAQLGSKEEFAAFARALIPGRDQLLGWDFGEVMELREHADPKNYLFSAEDVPLHWDGAFHRVPSFLVFYCVESSYPVGGGNTIFCNTERLRRSLGDAESAGLRDVRLTFETKKVAHYGGAITVDLLDRHPLDGAPIMRFAEPVATALNPVTARVEGRAPAESDAFFAHMRSRLENATLMYEHQWQKGDLLIADNHALVHGRRAFSSGTRRLIWRSQIL
jgi:alpha-ketoglutarate-dependent taurine dioxygenase